MVLILLGCAVDLERREARWPEELRSLTPQEAALLSWLAARPGVLASRAELLDRVWGWRGSPLTRTLDNTLGRLRAKVERDPAHPDHLITVAGEGVRFVPAPARAEDALLGRRELVARLRAALVPGAIVGLLGPGGVGKTRLAAAALAESVSLTVVGGAGLEHQIRDRLGLPAMEDVVSALLERGLTLFVDDADELGDADRDLLRCLSAERGRALCAARSALGLGELVRVPPLGLADGVRLYRERAGSPVPEQDAIALVEALDGLPLAIELAAARAGVLGPRELLARLAVLDVAAQGKEERHASLGRVVRESWEGLPSALQGALVTLCAFADTFTLEDAEGLLGPAAWTALEGLVGRSLLAPREADGRLRVYRTVRRFVASHQDLRPARLAHRAWVAAMSARAAEALERDGEAPWFERASAEIDAALALDEADPRGEALALRLAWASWLARCGPVEREAENLERAAALLGEDEGEARDRLRLRRGDHLRRQGRLVEAERILASIEGGPAFPAALRQRATLARAQGDLPAAQALGEEAVLEAQELEDRAEEAGALTGLGMAALVRGADQQALALFASALRVARDRPALAATIRAQYALARWELGDAEGALALLDASPERLRWGAVLVLDQFIRAEVHLERGELEAALEAAALSCMHADRLGWRFQSVVGRFALVLAALRAGDRSEAQRRADELEDLVGDTPVIGVYAALSVFALALVAGDRAAAEAALARGDRLAEGLRWTTRDLRFARATLAGEALEPEGSDCRAMRASLQDVPSAGGGSREGGSTL